MNTRAGENIDPANIPIDNLLNEDNLRTIIKKIPFIMLVHVKGIIVFTTDETAKQSGYDYTGIIGKNILEFIADEHRDIVSGNIKKIYGGEKSSDSEILIRLNNGQKKRVIAKSSNIEFNGQNAILTVLTDLTDIHNALSDSAKKETLLNATAEASELLLKNKNINSAISESLSIIGKALDADRVYLFANSSNDEKGIQTASQMFEWTSINALPTINDSSLQNITLSDFGDFFSPLYKRKSISKIVKDIESPIKDLLTSHSVKSILIFPIYKQNDFWGFVGFDDCRSERIWTEAEEAALNSFAASIAGAVERKQYEVDLLQAMESADRGNRAKSEFLANMSHEIRTPLNAILGFAELLQDYTEDPKYVHYLNGITTSGRGLLKIINDILDLSKIEAGKTRIETEPVNVSIMITEIKNIFSGLAAEKNIVLNIYIDPKVPKIVYIDETRIRQVLINLIGNAIKFTPRGSVSISVFPIIKSYSNKTDIIFEIKDTGVGIPVDQQEIIFEAFTQVDGNNRRNFGGTGLGLTITKRLVEMMNGRIFLKSELHRGSTFKVQLYDLKFSNSSIFNPDTKAVNLLKGVKFNNPLILIVEDVESNRLLVSEYLKNRNVRMIFAEDGKSAVEKTELFSPDIILMDIQMPVMDGFEASGLIRNLPGKKKIPIIAITAALTGENKEMDYVFDSIISKPVTRTELLSELNRFLPSSTGISVASNESVPVQNPVIEELTEDQLKALEDIIKNKLAIKHRNIKNAFVVDEIIEFADLIVETGARFEIDFLGQYGKSIKQYAESFRIEPLKKAIESFDDTIELIFSSQRGN